MFEDVSDDRRVFDADEDPPGPLTSPPSRGQASDRPRDLPSRPSRLCRNYLYCHSVQVKRDTESSVISKFWIPACAGMTILMVLSAITTQSHAPGCAANKDGAWKQHYD